MPRFVFVSVFVVTILAVLTVPGASAQISKGLFAGWNQSDWDHEVPDVSSDIFESKNGYCFGVQAGGNLSGNFGWRGEILYTRKGAKTVQQGTDESGGSTGDVNYFYNVDYLEIPALLTFTIPTRGAVRPVFYIGPAIDFELSSDLDAEYSTGVTYAFSETEDLEETSSPDFSLILAGGVDIDAGNTLVNVQVRYVMGLKEVYLTAKNSTFSIMAGIGI